MTSKAITTFIQAVAIETSGMNSKSTTPFLSGVAKKLVNMSGDPSECQWLHQHLPLDVVRGMLLAYWPVFDLILCSYFSCF